MNTHGNKVCSASYFHLFKIQRISKYPWKEITEKLVHAFFSSRIDYCNSLLYGLLAKQLNKIQRIQNTAAHMILRLPKFCHITPVLVDLHCLLVRYRIVFKICLFTFKALHGLTPSYISDLISVKENKYHLRSSEALTLNRPRTTRKTLSDRAFAAAAPSLWNSLPKHIRKIEKLNEFKRHLKRYLFRQAFSL